MPSPQTVAKFRELLEETKDVQVSFSASTRGYLRVALGNTALTGPSIVDIPPKAEEPSQQLKSTVGTEASSGSQPDPS